MGQGQAQPLAQTLETKGLSPVPWPRGSPNAQRPKFFSSAKQRKESTFPQRHTAFPSVVLRHGVGLLSLSEHPDLEFP